MTYRPTIVIALLLLMGAGCATPPVQNPSMGERPPEITLENAGNILHGAEGSYCYQGTCADKISPSDLVAGMSPAPLTEQSVTIRLGVDATEVTGSLLAADGTPVCDMAASQADARTYGITLCGVPAGNYLMLIGAQINGGDESYLFPVSADFPVKRTAFGTAVTLSTGTPAVFEDGLIALLGPINDSRCPENVACIWPGELSPVLTLSGGKLETGEEVTLGTTTRPQATVGPYTFTLTGVTETTATISVMNSSK